MKGAPLKKGTPANKRNIRNIRNIPLIMRSLVFHVTTTFRSAPPLRNTKTCLGRAKFRVFHVFRIIRGRGGCDRGRRLTEKEVQKVIEPWMLHDA